jgi:hypothetical protein
VNYKEKIVLSNKMHISSALYHLERVMPDLDGEKYKVGVHDLNTVREQLKLWERELHLSMSLDY